MSDRQIVARAYALLLTVTLILGGLAHETAVQLGEGLRATGEGQAPRTGQGSQDKTKEEGSRHYGVQDKQRQQAGSGERSRAEYEGNTTGSGYGAAIKRIYQAAQSLGNGEIHKRGAPTHVEELTGALEAQAARGLLPGGAGRDTPSLDGLDSLGTFEITAYTAGPESTGKRPGDKEYGITFSGAEVEEGVTLAADPRVLPIGSRVYIEGVGERLVQDTGSAIKGKKLDLYIPELDDALEWGRQKRKVYLIERGGGAL